LRGTRPRAHLRDVEAAEERRSRHVYRAVRVSGAFDAQILVITANEE